ncbi:FAD:protein FMN transferase [Rhodovibrionaceae bacterium A322]
MQSTGSTAVSRRRSLQIVAAAGLTAALGGAVGRSFAGQPAPQDLSKVSWQGLVLGAQASLTYFVPDPAAGDLLLTRQLQEIERLEQIFSLYRPDSAISRLNDKGELNDPPQELLSLLHQSQRYSQLTGGAFDVTVQPLWQTLARSENVPSPQALKTATALADWTELSLSAERISFNKANMAITLNGIAQGYITDRVTRLLQTAGLTAVLVNLGEIRALDAPPYRDGWQVGLQNPDHPEELLGKLELTNRALATSARGAVADLLPNLLDPRTGHRPQYYRSLTVLADDATTADALSTGFSALPPQEIKQRLSQLRNVEVWAYPEDAEPLHLTSRS